MKQKKSKTELSLIKDSIKEYFDCDDFDIFQTSRDREIVYYRQWFQFFAVKMNQKHGFTSLREIGGYFSDVTGVTFNHATVYNNFNRVSGFIDVDDDYKKIYDDINKIIMSKKRKSVKFNLDNKIKHPNNQYQQALWYVINSNNPFSLADVIKDSMFYKFQTRLGEIESEHGVITEKNKREFVNRFQRKSKYTTYKAIDKDKCLNLYELYN